MRQNKNKMNTDLKKNEETPAANWATWALCRAWEKGDRTTELAELIAQRLHDCLNNLNTRPIGNKSYLIRTNDGHWGRGVDLIEAAKATKKAGARAAAKVVVWVCLNDSEPYIDSMGYPCASSVASFVTVGITGTLGQIINANK
jgi:hypothetical protein